MSDEQISLLERYLLEHDKEKFFGTLVKNSDTYVSMRLLDHLNRYGLDLPKESKQEMAQFLNDPKANQTLIQLKHRLLEIQTESDEAKRKNLITEFSKKFMSVNLTFARPSNIKQSEQLKGQGDFKNPTSFDGSKFSFEAKMEDFFNQSSWEQIRNFRTHFYYRFDMGRLLDKKVECFEHVLNSLISFNHIPDLAKLMKKYLAEKRKTNKGFSINSSYYPKMTLQQLDELQNTLEEVKSDQNFITNYFQKSFERDMLSLTNSEDMKPEEYRALLLKMLEFTKKLPKNYNNNSFQSQILREILQSDMENNKFDKDTFLAYLENPNNNLDIFDLKFKSHLGMNVRYDASWHTVHNLKVNNWTEESKLIEEYLRYFFKTMTNFGEFEKYFTPGYLSKQFYTAKILNGENIDNITKIFNETELTQMRENKKLKFVTWNKNRFELGEEITLYLEVKNIQNFCVNIFEINTESYYRKNNTEINERINLTGLIPSKSIEKTLETPPIISQVLEFKNLFESKRGVYIVEFIGGGLSSRALIRIGSLSLIRQVLSKGCIFHMIDEKKQICASPTTDIFVQDKVFKPQATLNNGILIPYSSSGINGTAILRHEGYAELYNLVVPAEQVTFDMGLLFNEESLISGNQVSFLMVPKIYVNGKSVALTTIKKLKAEIISTNDIGINNTNNFDDLKAEPLKDLVINYLIPPKTERLTVKLSGKFYSSAQEKEIDIENIKSVTINRFRDRHIFYNIYLSQNGQNYVLHFLGKNGEPYPAQKVQVTFTSIYNTNNTTQVFETDSNGEIALGDLKNFLSINVNMVDSPCTEKLNAVYSLSNIDRLSTLPRSFDILEGEDICFPLSKEGEFNPSDYELTRVCKTNYASIITDLSKNIVHENGVVYLSKLPEGFYRFIYREHTVNIFVNVHKGKRWEGAENYLVKDKSIIKVLNQSLYLAYKDFKINGKKVSFDVLSNNMGSVQVHAFAFSYFPTNLSNLTQSIKSLKVDENTESFELGSNTNVFLSEKSLSDEVKYVLERKRKSTFMGNTLEKPSSLLKRHFVKQTQQDQEQLKAERDYESAKIRQGKSKAGMSSVGSKSVSSTSYGINNLNTFLGKEGWALYNILPDEKGHIAFELPEASCYGTLLFVIKDIKNSIVETRPLTTTGKEIRSVTLADSKKANKVYLYDRIAHKVAKGGTCEIKDLAATELSMVDDVQTLFKMLKLISTNSSLDEWDFLSKWNTMSPEEQLKKYDKYISHEFNVFAYFKDKEFFNLVVKPHIANKSKKDLIDYFLLGNEAELKKFLNPVKLSKLNLIETALLVNHFSATENEKCLAIANNLKQKVGSVFFDVKEFKRLFDSVLKAQVAQEGLAGAVPQLSQAAFLNNLSNRSNIAPMMQNITPMPMMMMQNIAPRREMMQQSLAFSNSNIAAVDRMERRGYNRSRNQAVSYRGGRGRGGYGDRAMGMEMEMRVQNESLNNDFDDEDQLEEAMDYSYSPVSYPSAPGGVIERYRTLGVTNEYIEKQYYEGSTIYISENRFWVDYMIHCASKETKPFLTENFIYANSSLPEMLFVLALVELPFEKGTHTSENLNNQLKLKAGSNCMVFSKEIQEKGDQKLDLDILISQRFYDPFDRYVHSADGLTKMLKNVTEFLVGKLYMSRVAITNSSESQHEINVVTEIPQGSVPVYNLEYMKSTNMNIEPLTTQVIEFYFYFPKEGEFTCYPASINKDGFLVTSATGIDKVKVVRTRQTTEMKTISDILSLGNKTDILNFMEKANLHNSEIFQFSNIYWLLDDKEFYQSVLALLRKKFIFDATVWSFSIKHGDYPTFVEYINQVYFVDNTPRIKDGDEVLFLDTDALKLDKFEFKEYNPLVNPRVHDIGEFKHNILNRDFKKTYYNFLKYLFQKTFLTAKDLIYFCTYLLLQDRIDDTLAMYPHIKVEEISKEMKIQYDYLSAYLDLYTDYPKFAKARAICTEYLAYPIFTWRNRFIDLVNQISEFDGDTELLTKQTEETDADKNQRQAKKEEYISTELQGKNLKVTLKNITSFTVKFYKIDLEIMYSQDPFLSVDKNDYSYVTPNHVIEKNFSISSEYSTELVEVPANLASSNLIIQVSSGALTENITYFPSKMKVFLVKNYGQVKVTSEENSKPLTNIYIKCFAKKNNGSVTFYKDGYTDLRGTFEYTSVHSSDIGDVQEFSILVYSDTHGAMIKQVKPPSMVSKVEVNANKVISAEMQMCQAKMVSKASNKYAALF